MESKPPPPAWFANLIIDGLQALYAIVPPAGRPAADQLKNTSRVWIDVLWNKPIPWDEGLDSPRITRAWGVVYGRVTEWITPAQFFECLPARPKQEALPPPEYPREKARENLAKIKRMLMGSINAKKM